MNGYKGFDKDLCCLGFQYEVGAEYAVEVEIMVCKNGFHFCERITDVHGYYNLTESRVCEVEALGEIVKEGDKCCTNRIKILRELSRDEIIALANVGNRNTGVLNSGDRNSGNRNSGWYNSGNHNSGNYNSGMCPVSSVRRMV